MNPHHASQSSADARRCAFGPRHEAGLTAFLEAAAAGSFTDANERLDLRPAVVVKNVIMLETELGGRPFNRDTGRIRLRLEGDAFAEQARESLRVLDNATYGVPEGRFTPSVSRLPKSTPSSKSPMIQSSVKTKKPSRVE